MLLLGLLFIPIITGLIGLITSKGKVTPLEFVIQEAVMLIMIGAGYAIALNARTGDVEIWNGAIQDKVHDTSGCCHSYKCNCHESCTGTGSNRSCHEVCSTCYEHSRDQHWSAATTNGETVFNQGCGRPGESGPQRWQQIIIGEPTSVEHSYTNYLKGNPDSILRRQGAMEKFGGQIPAYPQVYDLYRAKRFLTVGLNMPEADRYDNALDAINMRLGTAKQVNITLVAVRNGDQAYLEGLREAWVGGKKNDLIVAVGMPEYPAIAWAGVISWTVREDLKISIRDQIMDLKTFDGDKVLGIVEQETKSKFVRRPMEDFAYLKATVEPSSGVSWFLFFLGLVLSIGLTAYFWMQDPFGSELNRFRYSRRF
ncbi:hypothetical protein HY633_00210 [Candidatus Uhrbacteria bacterium]|nr:hypothetical protein [Candidatus Uhrbacteria bacterium]